MKAASSAAKPKSKHPWQPILNRKHPPDKSTFQISVIIDALTWLPSPLYTDTPLAKTSSWPTIICV